MNSLLLKGIVILGGGAVFAFWALKNKNKNVNETKNNLKITNDNTNDNTNKNTNDNTTKNTNENTNENINKSQVEENIVADLMAQQTINYGYVNATHIPIKVNLSEHIPILEIVTIIKDYALLVSFTNVPPSLKDFVQNERMEHAHFYFKDYKNKQNFERLISSRFEFITMRRFSTWPSVQICAIHKCQLKTYKRRQINYCPHRIRGSIVHDCKHRNSCLPKWVQSKNKGHLYLWKPTIFQPHPSDLLKSNKIYEILRLQNLLEFCITL
jgi:hypothetical protein